MTIKVRKRTWGCFEILLILNIGISQISCQRETEIVTSSIKNIARIEDPVISPDGEKFAFSVQYLLTSPKTDIWYLNLTTIETKRLTNSGVNVNPSWCYDSQRVVYLKLGKPFIYITSINLNGRKEILLESRRKWYMFPHCSPNADKIVFSSKILRKNERYQLFLLDTKTRRQIQLTSPNHWKGDFLCHSWSPDGKKIYFTRRDPIDYKGHLEVMNIDGTGVRQLTRNLDVGNVQLSPNGRKIAFLDFSFGPRISDLWIMDTDSTNLKQLTKEEKISKCVWSPNNREIACSKYLKSRNANIWIISINGDRPRQITQSEVTDKAISFFDNGKKLLFLRNNNSIWLINSDGTNPYQIFPKPEK